MTERENCRHVKVIRVRDVMVTGSERSYWVCDDCDAEFAPRTLSTPPAPVAGCCEDMRERAAKGCRDYARGVRDGSKGKPGRLRPKNEVAIGVAEELGDLIAGLSLPLPLPSPSPCGECEKLKAALDATSKVVRNNLTCWCAKCGGGCMYCYSLSLSDAALAPASQEGG